MVTRKVFATSGMAAMALVATPAQAQYMMHLDPNLYIMLALQMSGGPNTCITGMALPDKEVDEARGPAPAAMQGYFTAAQSGGRKSASFRLSKKAQWTYGSNSVTLEQIDAQSDPLAVTGNRLDPDTLRFFRAGDAQTAQGQWLVYGPDGQPAGLYDAIFKREKGEWKLERLTLYGAAEPVVPAMQYCTTPGDVTEHKAKASTDQIANIEKEIGKAEAKLEKAKAQLASDEAALAAKPGNTVQREAVRTAKKDVANREKKLADLKKNLSDTQEYRDKSNRDKAEIAAMTLPAADAARFRGFETTTAKEDAAKKAEEDAKKAEEDAKKKAEKEAKKAAKGS
jgi:hypothetical protein